MNPVGAGAGASAGGSDGASDGGVKNKTEVEFYPVIAIVWSNCSSIDTSR